MKPNVLALSALLAAGIVGCESAETEQVVADASGRPPTLTAEDSAVFLASRESETDRPALEPARYVTDPPGDRSALTFTVGNAQLLVTDPTGKRTGIDPTTGEQLEEIPRSVHYADALDNDVTGEPAAVTTFFVDIVQPSEGTYRVWVNGLEQGSRELGASAFSVDGGVQPLLTAPVILEVGSTSSFEVEFLSSPGAASRLRRLATFESTLEDISNCFELGLIHDETIANELTQHIQAAAQAEATDQAAASKNHLEEFRTVVRSLPPDQIDTAAARTLKEDADYLIGDDGRGEND